MDKLCTRIDHMIMYENDDFFINIELSKQIETILYTFQLLHLYNLITAFRTNKTLLDGSDTGTGKTYVSIAFCKHHKLRPYIICPKIMISVWIKVCDLFNITPLAITNYEAIKFGHTWQLPHNHLIIFDEVHRCKNPKTLNAKLLLSAKNKNVLMLSATLSDKPETFHIFGLMLGFYDNIKKGNSWIKGMLNIDKLNLNPLKLSAINSSIYPNKGSRMQISELGDQFPANNVIANEYHIDDHSKKLINECILGLNNTGSEALCEITRMRQVIESVKVDIIYDLVNDHLEDGYSIVVFLNYNANIDKLAKLCNQTTCIVNSTISDQEKENNINSFQSNTSNLIICNISAAEGKDFHDIHGNHKRVSLISPSHSSTQLKQALGRINRTGALTPALQKIIFCADTYEQKICENIKTKLNFLAKLNDNDLLCF